MHAAAHPIVYAIIRTPSEFHRAYSYLVPPMLHFKTHIIDIHAEWVTFVHGAGGSSNIWFKQLRDFGRHFNLLLVDLRGHGGSIKKSVDQHQPYTFQAIGDDVIQVLDHLGINKSHFIGISLGTIIIRDLSERHGHRIHSLVMGGAVMKLNLRGQIMMRIGLGLQTLVPYMLLYRIFAFIIMPNKRHRESRVLFIREAKKLYQKEFQRWCRMLSELNPLLSLFRFRESGVPTLYIMGEEDYMFLPSISKLVQEHQSATLFVIPQCGHVVNIERPEVFNIQAIEFMKMRA